MGERLSPEFQTLGGLRSQLLQECPRDAQFRTILLTATLTQESFATLRTLFGEPTVVSAVHLRPEPTYWVSHAETWGAQRERVLEACRRVPRPFLLYVTLKDDAERWAGILRDDGMRRVRYVHGASGDRARVLELWRRNQIDAVVATSAFGLGMDKGDVRAVVHACVPETVDRFYQEVGRGGRDGRACVSVAVYTHDNLDEADGLNRERVITPDLGLERWNAMFATRPPGSEKCDAFPVDLRAKRPGQTRDNDANVGWNLQTLNLMARAGLLRLHAARPPEPERQEGESAVEFDARVAKAFDEYFATAVVEPIGGRDHRDRTVWAELIEPERDRTAGAAGDQLALLKEMLAGEREFSEALEKVYEVSGDNVWIGVDRVCGGCPACRSNGDDSLRCYAVPRPSAPALPRREPAPRLRNAAGVTPDAELAVVTYRVPGTGSRDQRRWADLILHELFPKLVGLSVREFGIADDWANRPEFRDLNRLCPEHFLLRGPPDGGDDEGWPIPRVTLLDPAAKPVPIPLELFRLARPFHLLLLPEDARDPNRPADPYTARHPTTPLNTLLERLQR
ncbi:MAG: helicase-related protein [Gemmataceae bacterium]